MRSIVMVMACAVAVVMGSAARGEARVEIGEGSAAISPGQGPAVLKYLFQDVPYKPYVERLTTPGGVSFLRDRVADHPHHHGLMWAWKVDGVNFWEEVATSGSQVHRQIKLSRDGFIESVDWLAADRTDVLLAEQRQIELCPAEVAGAGATVITWKSTFAPGGKRASVTLTGNHYHGLGMRFVKSMDGAGPFISSDGREGKIFRGAERLTDGGAWMAYRAVADGKAVTVAMFDDPAKNPRPATWFTMDKPFAYLAATMRLHEQPLQVTADKPLTVRYGVAAWDGTADAPQIEKVYRAWLDVRDR